MAASVHVDMKFGTHEIPNVCWEWGTLAGCQEERRGEDGWATSLETAVVIRVLDLIVAGELEAARARAYLARCAAAVDKHCDPHPDGLPEDY